ncbi:PIG-L family deacetylase [Methylobacterium sp. Leaf466]|uniref:PIG-L deacetylase family protein n=1 Tax=Methylobacterium sp. Leaf466 TaxID=1736386 RepID=UPI0006FC574D|nr:PIG-L family deacetylase [Methylobacterium sp. Leaf466]KQT76927.1 GlcNAc-PI de-N-acetylase [Methylobacterium sp. Leaf466]
MPTALALSPHLDDAAFSCGGTLATLAASGWTVVMATVFTGSVADPKGFALACQTDKGLGPDVDYMALRRAEDEAAATVLGVTRPLHLGFREAPHRGYGSAPQLFAGLRADDAIVDDLRPALGDLIAETAADLILAPQGIGGHVDHLQVILALQANVSQRGAGTPILWWRDFPYTVRHEAPKEPFAESFSRLESVTIGFAPEAEAAKESACSAYASQLGFQFGGRAGLVKRLAEENAREAFRLLGALPATLAALATTT